MCSIISRFAKIGNNSGGHIHIGTHVLGDKVTSWLNFLKIMAVYENVIFRFLYGEFLTARPSMKEYAPPVANTFWNSYQKLKTNRYLSIKEIIKEVSIGKHAAVNFRNVNMRSFSENFEEGNTVEFRGGNASSKAVIWQNDVYFLVKLLLYCKSNKFNNDIIDQRYKISFKRHCSKLKLYDEIYLEQALELCDMVFDNNFDKVYFLRQYLKSFQVVKINEGYKKAKKFTIEGIKNISIN